MSGHLESGLAGAVPGALFELAHEVGARAPGWVQGNGGNVSVKDAGRLWIKASGVRLDRMHRAADVACLELDAARASLEELQRAPTSDAEREHAYDRFLAERSLARGTLGRASMETGFHLVLPRPVVVHTHSVAAVLWAHLLAAEPARLDGLDTGGLRVVLVPAVVPGLRLTAAVAALPAADVYLLANHGVILHGATPAITGAWRRLEARFLARAGGTLAGPLERDGAELVRALAPLAAPRRTYYPDAAVFQHELARHLVERDGLLAWSGDAIALLASDDADDLRVRGLLEIWAATVALYRLAPSLPELSAAHARTTAALPTEAHRRGPATP